MVYLKNGEDFLKKKSKKVSRNSWVGGGLELLFGSKLDYGQA